jgi:class 3 adenylate cyclase/ActR/RegA family two-component response regulator
MNSLNNLSSLESPNLSNQTQADILIVDDKADNIRLLSSLLSTQGYTVRKALSGSMALTAVETLPPDLILLDITMPGMSGYEVCEALKKNPKSKEIPVIFLSALDEVFDKIKAFEVGGVDYMTKPFQVEEVIIRINTHLTLSRQRQQLLQQQSILEAEIQERKLIEIELDKQRRRSDDLLFNILPRPIAELLKLRQQTIASSFDNVTVLFADLVAFTPLAAQMPPIELVGLLNDIFSMFDRLVEQFEVEKVKTIGDAYMVVGGLPKVRNDHAIAVAGLALEMKRSLQHFRSSLGSPLQLRIGIHSGPVVAGVIGTKKFSYDLWGDTVNLASRMESQGEPGRIQLTETTYQLIHDRFKCDRRGLIEAKGLGEVVTYWLCEE